jgi:hypothetical protein
LYVYEADADLNDDSKRTFVFPGGDVYRHSVVSAYEGTHPQRCDPVPVPPVDQPQFHIPALIKREAA